MVMREQELQWGSAALKHPHPLLALLRTEGNSGQTCRRLGAHAGAVAAIAVHRPDSGSQAVIVSADCDGRVKLWQLRGAALSLLGTHALHLGPINCMELHQASGLLATAGADGCIRVWRLPQLLRCAERQHAATQVACWAGHGASISACCFTQCGRFLASAGSDGTVRLWQVSVQEPLAVLQLHATSLAFAAGDDAALLVAPDSARALGSFQHAPVLLSLRSLPACRLYFSQLDAAQRGGSAPVRPVRPAAAADPAVAVWLPSSSPPPRPRPAPVAAASAMPAAAPTPDQQRPGSRTPGSGGGTEDAGRRQVGSLATFGRRRQQQREQQQAGTPAVEQAAGGSDSWLPADDTPVRLSLPAVPRSMQLLASPLPPSPLSPAADQAAMDAAVLAVYDAPLVSGHSKWDPLQQAFVAQHGGHAAPVCSVLPLPTGLDVLTTDEHGVAKLWRAIGSSGSGDGSSYSTGILCTLLPRAADRGSGALRCRPLVSHDGWHIACGMPSGHVAVWELQYAQRPAAGPAEHTGGNASAYFPMADCAVTAVAWDAACQLLCCGDAAGHLTLRWL